MNDIDVKTQTQALAERARREKCRRHLLPFSQYVYPWYQINNHHTYIAEILERAERHEEGYTHLIISEPPQHGKSLQISTLFPAWYLGRNNDDPIIITAYGDVHAQSFSRDIRNIIAGQEYQSVFPGLELAADSKAKHRWNLERHRGNLIAAGIEGSITGKGAKLLIIDDPYKNRADAESQVYRENIIETYRSVLKTRMHKDCIVIVVMTRWHVDDLGGWLLDEKKSHEKFMYVKLPALAEENDPLGRRKYGALWSEKFPQPMMLKTKEVVGLYNWESMYQGNPYPPEGSLFKRSGFKIIESKKVPHNLRWVRYWDLATSETTGTSFTATAIGAMDTEGNVYIDRGLHARWQWGAVRQAIKTTALTEPGVLVGIESQGPQKGMIQECWNDMDLVGVGMIPIPVAESKAIRTLPAQARCEAGKLYLVEGDWNEPFILECVQFPNGDTDDFMDVLSGVMQMLGLRTGSIEPLDKYAEGEDFEYYNTSPDTDEIRVPIG